MIISCKLFNSSIVIQSFCKCLVPRKRYRNAIDHIILVGIQFSIVFHLFGVILYSTPVIKHGNGKNPPEKNGGCSIAIFHDNNFRQNLGKYHLDPSGYD